MFDPFRVLSQLHCPNMGLTSVAIAINRLSRGAAHLNFAQNVPMLCTLIHAF